MAKVDLGRVPDLADVHVQRGFPLRFSMVMQDGSTFPPVEMRFDNGATWAAAVVGDTATWDVAAAQVDAQPTRARFDLVYDGDVMWAEGRLRFDASGQGIGGSSRVLVAPNTNGQQVTIAPALPGPPGPQGAPGGSDAETALRINTGTETQAALRKTYTVAGAEATQRLMRKLYTETTDASLLVVGDSTGDQTNEWVYRLGQALAADWPRWTILYRRANDATSSYDAPVTIQTGTGARTLTIWNGSIPGFHALHFQGARAAWAIFPLDPDLILISLGHNEAQTPNSLIWSRYVSLTETITERLVGDVILIAQNPATANTYQQTRSEIYRAIAAARGFGFVDVQKAFLDTGVAPGLTIDGIHPTDAGSQLWADTVHAAFRYQPALVPNTQPPSTLTQAGDQWLLNGDFVVMPDHTLGVQQVGGWWADANTTIAQDTVNYESQRGYAVKLTAATAAEARFGQRVNARPLRGKWVTVAWRVYVPTGQAQTVGWTYLDDGAGNSTAIPGTYSPGAFQWIVASVKVGAAAVNLDTYIDLEATNAAGATVTVDRVVMSSGKFPRALSGAPDRATSDLLAAKASWLSGSGSPAGVVSAAAGTLYTRTDAADRVNEAKYPISDASTATTGWVAIGGTLTNPTGYLRNTLTAATGTRNIQTPNASTQPVTSGKQYTFSAQARTSDAASVQILAQFYTSAGAATGSLIAGAATVTDASTFTTLAAVTGTAPADAAFVIYRASISTATTTVGGTLDARHFMIEQTPTVGSYFDGNTAGASWLGTPEASASSMPSTAPALYVKTGTGATGWVAVARA